eukprot:scaffold86207_cov32-Tisochrysis_lutea.AAC.6
MAQPTQRNHCQSVQQFTSLTSDIPGSRHPLPRMHERTYKHAHIHPCIHLSTLSDRPPTHCIPFNCALWTDCGAPAPERLRLLFLCLPATLPSHLGLPIAVCHEPAGGQSPDGTAAQERGLHAQDAGQGPWWVQGIN